MLELANGELRVEVLDPVAESRHLGPRFCAGGFVWQVYDREVGELLSGPEYPHPSPEPFNGQGVPESFRHRTLKGEPLTWNGDRGVAIGAGELARDELGQIRMVQPCAWDIRPAADRISFRTSQQIAGFSYRLDRDVVLAGRTVRVATRLQNTAERPLVLQWFAHPFFALKDGVVSGTLPAGSRMKANPGFALEGRTLSQVRTFLHQRDGHMEPVDLPAAPLEASFVHPLVGEVKFGLSRAPQSCMIWGNDRTFSIEPYLDLKLAPGESQAWEVSYSFGRQI